MKILLALLLCVVCAVSAQAQEVLYELTLKDGTRVQGYLEQDTPERVTLRTVGGARLEVPRADVVSLKPADGRIQDGRYLRADANPTRLFFGPTGRAVKKGEGYVGTYQAILPFVQYGITDRISIGGGTPIFFGAGSLPFWVTPKVQVYNSPRVSSSIGVIHFLNIDGNNLGIAYSATTIGTTDDALTVGLGWAYDRDERDSDGAPVLMIGGETRVSPRTKLITENYIFDGGGFVSGGVRFLGESLSADFGILVPLNVGQLIGLPIVNFVWKF
jgi:hypothetical protein